MGLSIPPMATLTIKAEVQNLSLVREFVAEIAVGLAPHQELIDDLILALDEAVTNIIIHGYQGKSGEIQIELDIKNENLRAIVSDHGPPYNPTLAPNPDITLPLEKRRPGGLGIYLMRQLTDQILYQRTSQGENQLTLIKLIPGDKP